ncbi:uncharacterized protein LOC110716151 [Chenopodium quinoa]|uniref:uncharacterized protein LOC110716151 n=1 Tax=Chenopodium quinoa TaxID=63459 RepID=UPI000B77CD09|nr:uncharacterized protein LOC110716151 [Chenopodium quinoa]
MGKCFKDSLLLLIVMVLGCCKVSFSQKDATDLYVSAVGDPGMRRDGLRVAIESWNQCNEVGEETPNFGSPRAADCFDLIEDAGKKDCYSIQHKVTEQDNLLGVGNPIPGGNSKFFNNVDLYAAEKEVYLGSRCKVEDKPNPWHFWMIMLKNGNMDTYAALCPKDGKKVGPYGPDGRFDCFGKGCMNHPTMYHNYTKLVGTTLIGRFFGTWDVDIATSKRGSIDQAKNISFYSVTWEKEIGKDSWVFRHVLKTSTRFPWLMLYLRSDAIQGFSGGYHYNSRGMIKTKYLESPNFTVRFTLNVTRGRGSKTQFYLMDMGSCWKNNGKPCDGDVTSDVTRYSEMIITPETEPWCKPDRLELCPPYHTFLNGTRVHRNDTKNFPYDAYHMHCSPGNAKHLEEPSNKCDPFSNPQPQEILQILPHPVWGEYGYPTQKGEGWIGDPKTWWLDVGKMSQNLYFYQDPGTRPIKRRWTSIDLGVEVYRDPDQVIEWTVSDFNILVPQGSVLQT